jgi:hypothetical protein
MSFRFSIGSRWFEVHILTALMVGAKIYLQIECGHNSTRNIISWRRSHTGAQFLKLGRRKTQLLVAAPKLENSL